MLIRVLWVPPSERAIQPGDIVDHYNGAQLIEAGDAEKAPKGARAEKHVQAPPAPEADADPTVEA